MRCRAVRDLLHAYLARDLQTVLRDQVRAHLDSCGECWSAWNRVRWDAASGTPLLNELREFLGPAFRPYFDSSTQLARDWDHADPSSPEEVADFFRASEAYLYNLTVWEVSGHRPRYLDEAAATVLRARPRVVLDYGCGIGSDLLGLRRLAAEADAPFTVIGCDYASPSTGFLHHRLRRRGLDVPVVEPQQLGTLPQPDVLWIIDTLDHLSDLDGQLGPLLSETRLLVCEDLSEDRTHGAQRFHNRRQPGELAGFLQGHGLLSVAVRPCSPVSYWTRAPGSP